ncbi:hypothetical protein D5041_01695 [Verminephrobacter aporrectodeae subsp. tuberculatae]|nr:hypothetical protein [Verminephrobacter aporrectodeae]MCW5222354.1 hypothetical protein [Verminephrobacter aporrectodeae subsp. tuberculatae]MCW5287818.1 hypothetical protein [Verminephrobacter aporrectodeae subsp. tuberculatae]
MVHSQALWVVVWLGLTSMVDSGLWSVVSLVVLPVLLSDVWLELWVPWQLHLPRAWLLEVLLADMPQANSLGKFIDADLPRNDVPESDV